MLLPNPKDIKLPNHFPYSSHLKLCIGTTHEQDLNVVLRGPLCLPAPRQDLWILKSTNTAYYRKEVVYMISSMLPFNLLLVTKEQK